MNGWDIESFISVFPFLRQVVEYLKRRTNKKLDLVHGDLDADYERVVR